MQLTGNMSLPSEYILHRKPMVFMICREFVEHSRIQKLYWMYIASSLCHRSGYSIKLFSMGVQCCHLY